MVGMYSPMGWTAIWKFPILGWARFLCVNHLLWELSQKGFCPKGHRNITSHSTVWRTWVSIAYSDERWLYYQFSQLIHFSSKSRMCEHSCRASFWGDAYTVRKWTKHLRTKIRKFVSTKRNWNTNDGYFQENLRTGFIKRFSEIKCSQTMHAFLSQSILAWWLFSSCD